MKKNVLFLLLFSFFNVVYGQIGVNTPNPQATMDVMKNLKSAVPPAGIIAPRLTGDEIQAADANYSSAQLGAIVYATSAVTAPSAKTANITQPCYYYFDGTVWQNLGCQSSSTGSLIVKTIYSGTDVDPAKVITIGGMNFRFVKTGGVWNPQISLSTAISTNKNIYVGFNQQYSPNGYQYANFTKTFTPANYSTFQDIAADGSNNIVTAELNFVHIVDVEANTYYRVTFYVSGPSPGAGYSASLTRAFVIVAEKF